MITNVRGIYEPSHSIVAQGSQVKRYEKEGYYKKYGGNGTYRMVKPSKTIIRFNVNGEIREQSVKQLIRDTFGIVNVSKDHLDRLINEYELDYSDNVGLFVKSKR